MVDSKDNSQTFDSNGPESPNARVLQELCERLEDQLRAGKPVRSEHFLALHPWLVENVELAMDLIYTEYVTRREMGQLPAQEEYLIRFPQWVEQLKHQFELDALLVDSPTLTDEPVTRESSNVAMNHRINVRYRVIEALARGGVGEIKRALDTEVNREVAVKSIQPSNYLNPAVMTRFLREAEITGRLEHPGIVPVYGMGLDADGIPFYAMRLIRGQNFQDAIIDMHQRVSNRGRYMSKEFLNLLRRFLSICETIAYAHSRGVIHRDIKPQNIMLGPFGEALVVDWGLARQLDTKDGIYGVSSTSDDAPMENPLQLESNQGRFLVGTPAFMSPEQASGQSDHVGPHSDVYSLGATLYMLLTGASRFENMDIESTLQCVINGRFQRPRDIVASIPRGLEEICLKALSKDPPDRYQSASEMASDIEHWLADEPISAAKDTLIGLAARFERRNRAAVMATTVGLLLVSIITIVAALRINQERLIADGQRVETQRQGARLAFDRGFSLINEHEVGKGMLWFEQALRLAPSDESDFRRVILTNMASARREILHRKAAILLEQSDVVKQFSNNGRQLLTTSLFGWLTLIDVESSKVLWKHQLPRIKVIAVGFSKEDRPVLVYINGISVVLQTTDISNVSEPFGEKIELPTGPVDRVILSSDERWLATGVQRQGVHQIQVWDLPNRKLSWDGEVSSSVVELKFLDDNTRLVVVEASGQVTLYNFQKSPPNVENWLHNEPVRRIAVSSVSNRLFAATTNGSIAVWDLVSKRRVYEFPRYPGEITSIACSTDGTIVAAAWDSGIARLWLVDERRPASEALKADRFVSNLSFRPHSRQLLVRQSKQYLWLLEVPNPSLFAPQIQQPGIQWIALSNDGNRVATAARNGIVQIRDARSGASIGKSIKHKSAVQHLAFLPDNSALVTTSFDGTAKMWNAQNGLSIGKPMIHRSVSNRAVSIASAEIIPSQNQLVTGDSSGGIRIWDFKTGELIRTLEPAPSSIISISASTDGHRLVAGYGHPDYGLRLWNIDNGELIWSSVGNKQVHTEAVRVVAFSPDDQFIISGSNDDTARFWNAHTGEVVGLPMQHRGELFEAKFSPNGRLAVTAGYDSTVRLWNVPEGTPYGSSMQHEGLVLDVAFDSSGQRLLSGSVDKTARLWDVQTCLPLARPLSHSSMVSSVCFNPDSKSAVTGRIWKLPDPLPDNTELIGRWVRLVTQRTLADGNQLQWIDHAKIAEESEDFHKITGESWQTWGQ